MFLEFREVSVMRICEYCGSVSEATVCPNCGASMVEKVSQPEMNNGFNSEFNTYSVNTAYQEPKEKFYQKAWFIILMLFLFWPVGVALMWIYKKFPLAVRIIISVFFGLALIGSL